MLSNTRNASGELAWEGLNVCPLSIYAHKLHNLPRISNADEVAHVEHMSAPLVDVAGLGLIKHFASIAFCTLIAWLKAHTFRS